MDERAVLVAALDDQRAHVLAALDGLTDASLRRPVLPSGWSCLGMVHHLTLDVERFWFRAVVAGEQVEPATGNAAWDVPSDIPAGAVLAGYREEISRADAVLAGVALDGVPAHWPVEIFPDLPVYDVRRTVLHVVTETACHAGHLDAARELLDGHQHLVLT